MILYILKTYLILVVCFFVAKYVYRDYLAHCLDEGLVKKCQVAWLCVLGWSFFAPNYWLFLLGTALIVFRVKDSNPIHCLCIFLVAVLTVPNWKAVVAGFGPIQALVNLGPVTVMSAVLLLPNLKSGLKKKPIFSVPMDKFLLAFWALIFILDTRDKAITGAFRLFFDNFFMILLPYLIITRFVNSISDMNKIIASFIFAVGIAAAIGIFEGMVYKYHIYNFQGFKYGYVNGVTSRGSYRMGMLRAKAMLASPISLGIYSSLLVLAALYLYPLVKKSFATKFSVLMGFLGLFVSFARGCWLGGGIAILLFTLREEKRIQKLFKASMIGLLVVVAIAFSPYAEKFRQDILPSSMTGIQNEKGADKNIDYRKLLFEQSLIVIGYNPLYGDPSYIEREEMQELVQGQGIIDVVNSYLGLALRYGLVTLALFLLIHLRGIFLMNKIARRLKNKDKYMSRLCKYLSASSIALLIMIANMSQVGFVPLFLWLFVSLIAAAEGLVDVKKASI